MQRFLFVISLAAATFASSIATAATWKVEVWDIPGSGVVPDLTTAETALVNSSDAIYRTTDINFGLGNENNGNGWFINQDGSPMSVLTFLNGNDGVGANFVSGNSGLTIDRTIIEITGKARLENGATYTFLSDDGWDLLLGGSSIARIEGLQPPGGLDGSGGFDQIVFSGATAVYDVTLRWFEGKNTQVQLVADLPSPVPLPAAGWMLLAGLGGLVAMKRRKCEAV